MNRQADRIRRQVMSSSEAARVASTYQAFFSHLKPCGSSHRGDDPNCVWVRFSQSDWDALEAIRNA